MALCLFQLAGFETGAAAQIRAEGAEMIETTSFGVLEDGHEAHVYQLSAGDVRVRVSDFGATLLGVDVPDRNGDCADVVLGFSRLIDYAGENGACFGATIGPVANRTADASVVVNGATYQLEKNEHGKNNLHTSLTHGLHKRLWTLEHAEDSEAGGPSISLACELADGELGLPGNRRFMATYSLAASGTLTLTYRVATDAPTFVNVTNHTYFNLAGHAAGPVDGQLVRIFASRYVPIDETSIPTGELAPVASTPFDFLEPHALGERVEADDVQIQRARGYDHCFCVDDYVSGGAPRQVLHAEDPLSGRMLDVAVTDPGVQLYTGNWLGDKNAKDGASYGPRSGFAVEPEFYPDCAHHPAWPQPTCEPGHPFESTITYRFSTVR